MIPRRIFWVIDAALIAAAFWLAYAITPAMSGWIYPVAESLGARLPDLQPLISHDRGVLAPIGRLSWILAVIVPAALFALEGMRAYGGLRHMSRTRLLLSGPVAVTSGLSAAAVLIVALRSPLWSRLLLFVFGVVAASALTGIRALVRAYHRWQARAGYYTRNALLVGPEETLPALVHFVRDNWPERDYRCFGYLEVGRSRVIRLAASARGHGSDAVMLPAEPAASGSAAIVVDVSPRIAPITVPRLGSVDEVSGILVRRPIHEVIVGLPDEGGGWFARVMAACDKAGVPLRMVPYALLHGPLSNLRSVRDVPDRLAPSILLAPRDLSEDAIQVKRLMDVTVSAVALILLSPVFAVVAAIVKLSGPGPIFYRWHVVGQHGKEFTGYKFRTMVENADALKPQLLAQNEMAGAVFKMRDDPRVTRTGRWLRKYSLDELPQLWNVLKGDMSLVGPRPAFPTELERYEFWHVRKLSIRPGLTCLWQVRGRNAITNFDEWVRMDLEYIDGWSLWTDLKILARTALAVVKGTGH